MKLAILHAGDLDTLAIGGVDRYIKSLIEYFDNGEITVFGTGKLGKDKIGEKYVRVYHGKEYVFIPISLDKRRPLAFYFVLNEFRNISRFSEYDCIYAQRTELSIPFLFSKNNTKLVQIIHGSNKYSLRGFGRLRAIIHLFLESLSIRIAKKTFIILNREEFGVPYYKKLYPKYTDRIFYAKNPINPNIFHKQDKIICRSELSIEETKTIIIYVGRLLNVSKRVLLLPQICRILKDRGLLYDFVILGDGPDRKRFENEIHNQGVDDLFTLIGYIDDTETICHYYNAADVAVNVSAYEGTCTSNLEALCCGVPLVATDAGDIREVLDGVHNGFVVPNIEDGRELASNLADAIEKAVENPPVMNQVYLKYSGAEVVKELKTEMEFK